MTLPLLLMLLLFGMLIGLALGALGGGGSLLTVPLFVYVLHEKTQIAVLASLVIVGSNAAVGLLLHYQAGHVRLKKALLFASYSLLASYLGARLSSLLPGAVLLTLFGLLMLLIATTMLRPKERIASPFGSWWMMLLSGAGVGFLTGFLGVGGGFLIVPAFVFLLGLSMPDAVGSSLVVITFTSVAGILGHLGNGPRMPWTVIGFFALAGLIGVLIGTRLTKNLSVTKLRQVFACGVLVLGIIVLTLNVAGALHSLIQ